MVNQPRHALRDVRRQVESLLHEIDTADAALASPDAVPDLGDYDAPVMVDGRRYRVASRRETADELVVILKADPS